MLTLPRDALEGPRSSTQQHPKRLSTVTKRAGIPSLLHFRFRSAKAKVAYQISRYLEFAGFGVPSGHAPVFELRRGGRAAAAGSSGVAEVGSAGSCCRIACQS